MLEDLQLVGFTDECDLDIDVLEDSDDFLDGLPSVVTSTDSVGRVSLVSEEVLKLRAQLSQQQKCEMLRVQQYEQ